MKKKRGDWKAYECLCYHVGGENFPTGRNLPALKLFLSTDQPWSRKQHTTHPRQRPEGYKASHNPPLPNGRRVIQQFTIHPRQKARGLQSSKPPNLPWSIETHICLSELPGSPSPWVAPDRPPQTQISLHGDSRTSTEPVGPPLRA